MLARLTEAEINGVAHLRSVVALAVGVAPLISMEVPDVAAVIWSAPPNLQMLLITPEGWQALACYVAEICGRPMPDFTPTVH